MMPATQAALLSTTNVDVLWKSLWKTFMANFAIKHLARSDEILRR